jgi:hypothetical protein
MAVERPAPNAATGFANARAAGSRPLLVEQDMTASCANLAPCCQSATGEKPCCYRLLVAPVIENDGNF